MYMYECASAPDARHLLLWQGCDRDPTMGGASPGPMYNPPAQPGVTPPAFSFGISDRQANPTPARLGAAHVMLPSGFQRQLETHKFSAPVPFFGTSVRRSHVQVAAPGDYDAPGVGCVVEDSRRATSASFGFSKSQRFYDHRGTCAPGPGENIRYLPRAHGEQPTSDKPTRPSTSFPRASREHGSAVAPTRQNAPGPGTHTPRKNAAMGEQINSRRRSSSGFGFGTSDRFPRPTAADVPGPGKYTPCL